MPNRAVCSYITTTENYFNINNLVVSRVDAVALQLQGYTAAFGKKYAEFCQCECYSDSPQNPGEGGI